MLLAANRGGRFDRHAPDNGQPGRYSAKDAPRIVRRRRGNALDDTVCIVVPPPVRLAAPKPAPNSIPFTAGMPNADAGDAVLDAIEHRIADTGGDAE